MLIYIVLFTAPLVSSQWMLGLGKGERCEARNVKGKCSLVSECPQLPDVRLKRPVICSFEGNVPYVCCPEPAKITTGRAKEVCGRIKNKCRHSDTIQVPKETDTSSTIYNYIIGGKLSKSRTHLYMALIGYQPTSKIEWGCGGSLISDQWVLSAAHCTEPKGLGPARVVRVGELDRSTTSEDAKPQDYKISQRVNHPDYKEPAVYNDIALYKLVTRVTYNYWVAPICLHTSSDIPATKGTVAGWGRTGIADDVSSHLMEVDVSLVNTTECRRLYGSEGTAQTPSGVNGDLMVCAGEKEGGKDACLGDSGGPLLIKNNCVPTLIGIVSTGKLCALPNTPGIYTRVSHYIPWIESYVWP